MFGWIKKLYSHYCKIQEDVPHTERKERAMNVREKSLKTILEKHGLVNYILLGEGQGTAIRLPPKDRYAPARVLNPPPRYLILVESNVDNLIEGLDPKSLQKVGSLVRYLRKQIKKRITGDDDGQK